MWTIEQRGYGGAEMLALQPLVRRPLRAGELRVAMEAAAVTRGDLRLLRGDFPGPFALVGKLFVGLRRPRAAHPGIMFAGRVVESAAQGAPFAVGDAVFGMVRSGAFADELVVRVDDAIAHRPADLPATVAAALPYAGGTADHALDDVARLRSGERLLVVGALGDVGRAAVSLARARGAQVTALVRTRDDRADSLAADDAVRVVEGLEGLVGLAADARFDVVLDTNGVLPVPALLAHLAPRGRLVGLVTTWSLLGHALRGALGLGPRVAMAASFPNRARLERLATLARDGVLTPTIAREFPLREAGNAYEAVAASGREGVIVVRPDGALTPA